MANGSISTSDFPSYVLDGLFDSFGKEIMSDDDCGRNYDDVGKLNNKTDQLVLIDTQMPVKIKDIE